MHLKLKAMTFASLLLSGCAFQEKCRPAGHWFDLTHSFSSATLYWPTSEPFHLEPVFSGTTDKGFHYAANRFGASEHGGTHMDAPIHFAARGETVDQVQLTRLIGPAVVIDISSEASGNRDYRVGLADFATWEQAHGTIPEHTIVLIRTGYARFWPHAERYLGTGERGKTAVAKLHFPGLDPEAALWLVDHRRIKAVGLDTASIDYGQSSSYESHQILSEKGIPIFENVNLTDQLPPTGAMLIALPMKIEGGSGAPLRIIAWVPTP